MLKDNLNAMFVCGCDPNHIDNLTHAPIALWSGSLVPLQLEWATSKGLGYIHADP